MELPLYSIKAVSTDCTNFKFLDFLKGRIFSPRLFLLLMFLGPVQVMAQVALIQDGIVTGQISTIGETDEFVFNANAGEAVHIRVVETGVNTSFYPEVRLYNPNGTLLATDYDSTVAALDCFSTGSCKLQQTGTYRILVTDDDDDYPGNYEIHFSHMPYANESGFLISGQGAMGSITTGDIDSFVFFASAGDSAIINVSETGANTSFYPEVWLYNPDGTRLATDYDNTVASLSCY
ncbi:MAG: hypothetical protein R3E64_16325, partial [Halioglobus sp.]